LDPQRTLDDHLGSIAYEHLRGRPPDFLLDQKANERAIFQGEGVLQCLEDLGTQFWVVSPLSVHRRWNQDGRQEFSGGPTVIREPGSHGWGALVPMCLFCWMSYFYS